MIVAQGRGRWVLLRVLVAQLRAGATPPDELLSRYGMGRN